MRMTVFISFLAGVFVLALPGPAPVVAIQDSAGLPEVDTGRMFRPEIEPITIRYEADDFLISEETHQRLLRLAARLQGTRDQIRITAHSGDAQLSTHEAVRLSFQRAVYVRIFLLENGVEAEQVFVEALPQPEEGPSDIVRIVPVER